MESERSERILTKQQEKWIAELERDFPNLPIGAARIMVELYETNPDFFDRENIDKLAKMPAPIFDQRDGPAGSQPAGSRTAGTFATYSGEDAERFVEEHGLAKGPQMLENKSLGDNIHGEQSEPGSSASV